MPSRYCDEANQLLVTNDDTVSRSVCVVVIDLGGEEEATAVPDIKGRLADGRSIVTGEACVPFVEDWGGVAVPGSRVVNARIGRERAGRRWLQTLFSADLACFYTV